jgi:hypothetical protein
MNARNHSLSARVAEIALEGSGRWEFVRVDAVGGRCDVCHLSLVFVAHLQNELTGRKVTLGLDCLDRFVGFNRIKAQAKAALERIKLERAGRAVDLLPLLPDLEKMVVFPLLSEKQRLQAGDFLRSIKSGRLRTLTDGQRGWIDQMRTKLEAGIIASDVKIIHHTSMIESEAKALEWLGPAMAIHPESGLSKGRQLTLNLLDGITLRGGLIGSVNANIAFEAITDLWLIADPARIQILGVDVSFSSVENALVIPERLGARICQPSQVSFRGTLLSWFAQIESPFLLAPISDPKRPSNWIPVSRINVAAHVDDGSKNRNWKWSGFVLFNQGVVSKKEKHVMNEKELAGRIAQCEAKLRRGRKLSEKNVKFLQENAPELLKQYKL